MPWISSIAEHGLGCYFEQVVGTFRKHRLVIYPCQGTNQCEQVGGVDVDSGFSARLYPGEQVPDIVQSCSLVHERCRAESSAFNAAVSSARYSVVVMIKRNSPAQPCQ